MMPCPIAVEHQKWRWLNHHKTPASNAFLTCVGMCLDQVNSTYSCLQLLSQLNIGWSSQKWCPAPLLLSTKNWRWLNHHKTSANNSFLTCVGMSLDQVNSTYPMFNSFYYNWSLAEAAKIDALPHCCWVPKTEDDSATIKLLQINLS